MIKADKMPWKRLSVEAIAIVGSILLAFSIDAWWEDLARSSDEVESLELIRRDLETSVKLLEQHVSYVAGASQSALNAYAALSVPGPYDREYIHDEMLQVDRVTLKIPTAAYTELLSTGNLRVIQDRRLRDAIVRFYESVELVELIVQKNNDVVLDRQLMGAYYAQGLILPHTQSDVGDDDLNAMNKLTRQRLGEDFVHQPDPMWNFQQDSREWEMLRSLLLNSANIHIIGEVIAQEKIVDARELLDSIENWLNTR
jgi:hypothetical protein